MALAEKLTITHIELVTDRPNVPKGFWEDRVTEITHPELKNIYVLENREEAARFTAEKILDLVSKKPDAAISWPSSNQGNDVIDQVVKLAKERNISFENVQFFHLDEYFPIEPTHKNSFRKNLRERLFEPLHIPPEHIHEIDASIDRNGNDVAIEYEALLSNVDIDLVLHPIGPDGHMGFNEMSAPRESLTHLTQLSDNTVYRDHILRGLDTPNQAITQGIDTILRAKNILFIDFSPEYIPYMKDALYGEIGSQNPSSFLRTVGDKVQVIMPKNVAEQVIQ